MITDQQKHTWLYNLANLPPRHWPFAHCILEQTIPTDLYAEMQANMPPHEEFVPLHSTGRIGKGAYPQRFIYPDQIPENKTLSAVSSPLFDQRFERMVFWHDIRKFLLSREFALALAQPYGKCATRLPPNPNAWMMDTLLIEDLPGYRIGPHADAPHKVLSALFYLSPGGVFDGEHHEWGTSLYRPAANLMAIGLDANSGRHYEFEQFEHIATVPYRWNHGLSFLKSDTSWHGVEQIPAIEGERRIVLLADIKLRR